MSENQNQHGRREAPGGGFSLKEWWAGHRAWYAGLERGARFRYRLCQALSAIAALVIVVVLFLQSWIKLPEVPSLPDQMGNNAGQVDSSQLQTGLEYDGAELPNVAKSGRKDGYYTFLLCGKDVVSGSTDTMILITYDTQNKTINAISLLRDTMTNISAKGGSQKRLNTIYTRNLGDRSLSDKERTENGMTALKLEVSRLTGIYPDFYVLVEWEAIGRLVEAVGGVEFEVPFDMDYDDPYQDLHIHQKAGLRLLNGDDAMQVIRFRKNNTGTVSLGDAGRTQIQRDFLTAVLKKCLTPEILLKLPSLVQIFTENVETDLTVGNILAFAQLAVGMDAESGVKFVPMPYYGVMYNGASLVCVQQDEMLKLLNDGINPYLDDIQASDLQLMYQKSGGGFGVTNGTLADPSVAQVYVAPKPAEPDETNSGPGEDDENEDPENPGGDEPGSGTGLEDPGQNEPGGGDPDQPGADTEPGDIRDIDPSVVFPDPSPDIQNSGGYEGIAADGLNFPAA